jgi:alpha-L-rhamnosidase
MANTPLKKTFSQHASILSVLTGCVPATETKNVMKKILYDTSLSQATFYYRFLPEPCFKKSRHGRYVLFAANTLERNDR